MNINSSLNQQYYFSSITLYGFLLGDIFLLLDKFNIGFIIQLITIAIIYLIFLIIFELNKKEYILNIRDAISLGLLLKILILLIIEFLNIEINILLYLLTFDFLACRFIAYKLINIIIKESKHIANILYILNLWMKIAFYSLVLYAILILLNYYYEFDFRLNIIFSYLYMTAMLLGSISIYKLRKLFN